MMGELAEAKCGTSAESDLTNTAKHMVDALTYLIEVASDSGYLAVASRLRSARSDLMIHQTGFTHDDRAMHKTM